MQYTPIPLAPPQPIRRSRRAKGSSASRAQEEATKEGSQLGGLDGGTPRAEILGRCPPSPQRPPRLAQLSSASLGRRHPRPVVPPAARGLTASTACCRMAVNLENILSRDCSSRSRDDLESSSMRRRRPCCGCPGRSRVRPGRAGQGRRAGRAAGPAGPCGGYGRAIGAPRRLGPEPRREGKRRGRRSALDGWHPQISCPRRCWWRLRLRLGHGGRSDSGFFRPLCPPPPAGGAAAEAATRGEAPAWPSLAWPGWPRRRPSGRTPRGGERRRAVSVSALPWLLPAPRAPSW